MKPIFCGNLDFDAKQSDVDRLFRKYGRVDRVDMKSGFCFVYMEDERDAEDAIRRLDRIEFGRKGRRIRVEWTKQERGSRRPDSTRKSSSSARPSKTLFVINFDPINTRTRDIEKYFEHYGKISNVRIRRNFAFVQYELQEDATRALEETHLRSLSYPSSWIELYQLNMQSGTMMTKEMGTALMEEDVTRLLIEETMIADVPQVPIKEIGVALTMDMDLYQILDQNEGAVLNMEEQKALPMIDTTVVHPRLHGRGLDHDPGLEKEEHCW
ncbi:hypothetical protein SASPL_134909 [Salvia splendens]|uniref:RRM domain-containing protein n=1 Tax=Salvia splendens TaxID=180675 RepID=A0A8X8ZFG1_SALSN|nr:hypothetical protein SASPL_134909 [Salvia splendens]